MKNLSILAASVFIIIVFCPVVYSQDQSKLTVNGKTNTASVATKDDLAALEKRLTDTIKKSDEGKQDDVVADKLVNFYQNYASDTLTIAENEMSWLIGVFAFFSAIFLVRAYQANKEAKAVLNEVEIQAKEAHKELEEIYDIKESIYQLKDQTREYLDKVRDTLERFLIDADKRIIKLAKESEIQIQAFIEEHGKTEIEQLRAKAQEEFAGMRTEFEGIRDDAARSARKATVSAFFTMGERHYDNEDYAQAVVEYDKAISVDPMYRNAYFSKALSQYAQNKYEEVLSTINELIRLNMVDANIYVIQGMALNEMKRYGDAIDAYNKSITLTPGQELAYLYKGDVLETLGDTEEALKCYDDVINRVPNQLDAYEHKGNLLRKLGRIEEAENIFAKVKELKEAKEQKGPDLSGLLNMPSQ